MKKLVLILLVLMQIASASAQDVSKEEQRKKKIEEEIAFINNQLQNISKKQKASTTQLGLIQKKVAGRKTIIKDLDNEIAVAGRKIATKQKEIDKLGAELDTLKAYYEKLVYNTYRNRDTKVWFMYVLASEDIGQGYRRYAYLKNLSDEVHRQNDRIKEKQKELEEQKQKLAQMKKEAETKRTERQKEYKKLVSEETKSKKELKSLSKSQKQYRSELDKKRKEVERLNREIEKILSGTVKKADKIDYALSSEFAGNKGKLPWPIKKGVISERFGVQYHPVYKNLKMPQNNGVTFTTERESEVYCVFDGVVKQVVVIPGYNQCVLVQHGEYFTFYCKLSKVYVKAGQKLKTGAPLGKLEAENKNSSSLHFQIWKGTAKQNPEIWIIAE